MTGQITYDQDGLFDKQHYIIPGEEFIDQMVPLFKYERIMDENQSLEAGKPVYKIMEVVEMRMAQDRNYRPVFPVDAVYRTIHGRPVTFAERWQEAYRAFLEGEEQHATGTPLEELKGYGITPAQLSMCRAAGIFSIEALSNLQGVARKRLGSVGNDILPMAQRWVAARDAGVNNSDEIALLKAQIAELTALHKPAVTEPAPVVNENIDTEFVALAGDPYPDKDDAALKLMIEAKTGAKPRGNPSRATLIAALTE